MEVARGERKLCNCARVNNATHLWAGGLDERVRGNVDGFAYVSDFQADVTCGRLGDNHSNTLNLSSLESLGRNADAISPRRKQHYGVVAFCVRSDASRFGGGETGDGYFSSDDGGVVRVFDCTGDAAGGLTLGESSDWAERKQATDPEQRDWFSTAHLLALNGHVKLLSISMCHLGLPQKSCAL